MLIIPTVCRSCFGTQRGVTALRGVNVHMQVVLRVYYLSVFSSCAHYWALLSLLILLWSTIWLLAPWLVYDIPRMYLCCCCNYPSGGEGYGRTTGGLSAGSRLRRLRHVRTNERWQENHESSCLNRNKQDHERNRPGKKSRIHYGSGFRSTRKFIPWKKRAITFVFPLENIDACRKPRLSRMCAALGKSHRWSKAVALSRWARVLEKARADEFAEEMLRCVCVCVLSGAGWRSDCLILSYA